MLPADAENPERKMVAVNAEFDFKPGDRVEFCGEEAVVVKNYGREGIVQVGEDRMRWYWVFEGEPVRLKGGNN